MPDNKLYEFARKTGIFYCEKCDGIMEFADKREAWLVCDKCGYSIETEKYGFGGEEGYAEYLETFDIVHMPWETDDDDDEPDLDDQTKAALEDD